MINNDFHCNLLNLFYRYPPCQLKTQLAKDIIAAFPKLCSANGGYVSII